MIARVLVSDAACLVFDEPTASLDPLAEETVLTEVLKSALQKTTIFVLHRLSIARQADIVFVLHEGKLIEKGSHSELIARGGKYAEMFSSQQRGYL